ncbi:tetratricopeptide repeat protein [Bradyrhizobium sp.]
MGTISKAILLGVWLMVPSFALAQAKPEIRDIQQKSGSCSALSVSNQGTIVINCPGIDPEFAAALTSRLDELYRQLRQLNEIGAETKQVFRNQNELIDFLRQEAKDAIERYQKLLASLPDDKNGKLAREFIQRGELDQAEALLQSEAIKEQQGIKQAAETQFRLGSIYALKLNWTGARPYFKKAFSLVPDDVFYAESFGVASYVSGQLSDAEMAWTAALKLYRERGSGDPSAEGDVATILSNIGSLYADTNRIDAAEKAFNESLKMRRQLAVRDPSYRGLVASTLYNLANLYDSVRRDAESKQSFEDSIAVYREAVASNPDEFTPRLALALSRLGYFYYQRNRKEEAEKYYKDAYFTFRTLAERNPLHRAELATAENDLAWFYAEEGKLTDAEKAYAEALNIFRELQQGDANGFQWQMARALGGLADIYASKNNKPEAEKAYSEGLALRRSLAGRDSSYRIFVANALINLGVFYHDSERYADAETMHKEALGIARDLISTNPNPTNQSLVAVALLNLGNDQRFSRGLEAEKSFKDALAIYRTLAQHDTAQFESLVATVQESLGYFYKDAGRFPDSKLAFDEALKIYKKLARNDPEEYQPQVVRLTKSLNDLAKESRRKRSQKSSR